jgi:hypothetical protein
VAGIRRSGAEIWPVAFKRIAGVDLLQADAHVAVEVVDVHALGLLFGHEGVVLLLHLEQVGEAVGLERPARHGIAVRADLGQAVGGIDHVHFRAGAVHQEDRADAADVVIKAPDRAPRRYQCGGVLERRFGPGDAMFDGLGVDPMRV